MKLKLLCMLCYTPDIFHRTYYQQANIEYVYKARENHLLQIHKLRLPPECLGPLFRHIIICEECDCRWLITEKRKCYCEKPFTV